MTVFKMFKDAWKLTGYNLSTLCLDHQSSCLKETAGMRFSSVQTETILNSWPVESSSWGFLPSTSNFPNFWAHHVAFRTWLPGKKFQLWHSETVWISPDTIPTWLNQPVS